MATKYKRAGAGNWNVDASWSLSSGGPADTVQPTAADDVVVDSASGNLTTAGTAVCRSLDFNGYTGTFAGSAAVSIGDGTAGAGNIALRLAAGMTYTCTGGLNLVSTSTTQQTITSNGKSIGSTVTINGSGCSYILSDALSTSGNITHSDGTFNTNGQTVSCGVFSSATGNVRTLTMGASSITSVNGSTASFKYNNASNLTVTANTATITMSGAGSSLETASINWNGASFIQTGSGAGGTTGTAGNFTCANFTRTGTAAKTDTMSLVANMTVTGTFTCNGDSAINRVLVQSNTVGTARTITAATWTITNTDFMDITGAGAGSRDLSAITGGSGDCGGNSGFTFTTAATQTWSGTSGGNWSTNAWTSRVPLPQDDVTINAAFSASQTITSDMPRLGKSISWTGATGSPTWSFGSTPNTIYGSITLITGMTLSGTQSLVFAGRGSFTITSAGRAYTMPVTFAAIGGTYTLNDGMSSSSGSAWTLTNGTFVDSGYALSWSTYNISGSATRAIVKTGAWDIFQTNGTTVWTATTTTNLTYSDTGTISIITTTANSRTFAGGGLTYGTLIYTLAGSTGKLTITGANSFAGIQFSDANNARTLNFTASTITTIRSASGWQVNGTAGKLMTVSSATAAIHTISCTSGTISSDYLDLSYSTATGGASFYAGANTTNSGNNSGWTFTDPPVVATANTSGFLVGFKSTPRLIDLNSANNSVV